MPTKRNTAIRPTGLSKAEQALELAGEKGFLRPRDLEAEDISREHLYRLVRRGRLERVGRGLYRLPGAPVSEHHTLAQVSKRLPAAVVCLISALRFHGLTTQMPAEVWIAIDPKARRPAGLDWPVRVVRFSGAALREGVETHQLEGVPVYVTSPAKTVADCFKYRNKIGLDVALEALRQGWRERRFSMDELWRMAEVCRVTNVIRPYVEALMDPEAEFDRSNLPEGHWYSARAISVLRNQFRRYLVMLFIRGRKPSSLGKPRNDPEVHHFTGFPIIFNNHLLWMTAGHVIDIIADLKNPALFTIEDMNWTDSYADESMAEVPVHYQYPKTKSWTKEGVDLGAILLEKLDRESLLMNKKLKTLKFHEALPLSGEFSPDGHYLLGFPDESTELTRIQVNANQAKFSWQTSLECLPLKPIESRVETSTNDFWNHPESAYAEIIQYPDYPDFKLDSIKGMSGGPVLAHHMKNVSTMGVRLMGIQSTWLPDSRIIRYEPAERLIPLVDAWLKEVA